MNTNQIKIFTVFSLCFLLGTSCATKPPLQTQPQTEAVIATKPEMSPRLYEYLASSQVKPKKQAHAEVITAFDVYCKATLPDGNRVCTFKNGTRKYTVSKQASETLADLLFGLNLSQGDSGVTASFIECSKYGGQIVAYSCDVAIPLDYRKP